MTGILRGTNRCRFILQVCSLTTCETGPGNNATLRQCYVPVRQPWICFRNKSSFRDAVKSIGDYTH
jgi:hypothetical protein